MKHEDFNSLEISNVLGRVLGFCKSMTKSESVHWISSYGLSRVRETAEHDWHWLFTSVDIVGRHMLSQPGLDPFPALELWRHVEQILPRSWAGAAAPHKISKSNRFVYPVQFENRLVGVMVFEKPEENNPVVLLSQFRAGMELAARYLHFAYQMLDAKNLSFEDELTGLFNQRYLPIALEHEIGLAKRDNQEFSLLFLDIDYFKLVNDGRGHWVGSRLLVELGKVLKAQVRACDYCFRYGGDEFILLLSGSNVDGARIVAERVRKAVEQRIFCVEGQNLSFTVSIGLASYPTHAQSAVGLIQLADQAMYYGKRHSRNIVFVAS